jgi:hypothetical protein
VEWEEKRKAKISILGGTLEASLLEQSRVGRKDGALWVREKMV